MALIVQDPLAPTASANSYLSLADWRTRASEIGLSLDADDATAEGQILTGQLYVDSFSFIGETVVAFQTTAWPRTGVTIIHAGEEVEYDNQIIPQQVIDSVLYAAVESGVYSTTQGGKRVLRKKIDVIETEYADDGVNAASFKRISRIDVMLSPFIYSGAGRLSNIVYAV